MVELRDEEIGCSERVLVHRLVAVVVHALGHGGGAVVVDLARVDRPARGCRVVAVGAAREERSVVHEATGRVRIVVVHVDAAVDVVVAVLVRFGALGGGVQRASGAEAVVVEAVADLGGGGVDVLPVGGGEAGGIYRGVGAVVGARQVEVGGRDVVAPLERAEANGVVALDEAVAVVVELVDLVGGVR